MTAFAFPNLDGGGVGGEASLSGGKIIQRISRPGLSDSAKPGRMDDAEAELVTRSQTGDPAAFEELVRQHQRMIHALTFRMTGSLANAGEDLACGFRRAAEIYSARAVYRTEVARYSVLPIAAMFLGAIVMSQAYLVASMFMPLVNVDSGMM